MNVITTYLKESFEELKKVTWPTKVQAVRLTAIVLVFCFVMVVFLTVTDFGFNELYTYVLSLAK